VIGKGFVFGCGLLACLLVLSCGSGEDSVSVNNRPPASPAIDVTGGGPVNNAANAPVPTTLHWTSYDPDNDPLIFTIYFGPTNPPDEIADSISEHSYLVPTTDWDTDYFWSIKATDPSGESATSSVWTFRTAIEPTP
jgi:hypothetical protein